MYQLEVKARLVAITFPPSDGWEVWLDVDPMERCCGGKHPEGKRERVLLAEGQLKRLGVHVGAHPLFGRADVVAVHPIHGTWVVEVEGRSARQREQAMYSALGQVVLMMERSPTPVTFALAVPDVENWRRQLRKLPPKVLGVLRLHLLLVSDEAVLELEDSGDEGVLESSDVHARVERALAFFTEREKDLTARDPSERALTHRLAIHLEREFPGWNVDCEFNRLGNRPKTIEVHAPRYADTAAEDAVTVFPDIIIHRRGPQGPNLVIIEAKKATSRADTLFDHIKLEAYRAQRGYAHAAFVILPAGNREGGPIEWICRDG